MNYLNTKEAHLMVWETNPQKRNINNTIKFNISEKKEVSIGDIIQCSLGSGKFSNYEIKEVLEIKPSSMSGMNYVTAKTNWFLS